MNKGLLTISLGGFGIQLVSFLIFHLSTLGITKAELGFAVNVIMYVSVNLALLVILVCGLLKD